MDVLHQFLTTTGFAAMTLGHFGLLAFAAIVIFLGVRLRIQPLLLLPLGFGLLAGNMPSIASMPLGVNDEGSVLRFLYFGVTSGLYPSLVFLGLGASTDLNSLLAHPRVMLLGGIAQAALLAALPCAIVLGLGSADAAAIGLAGTGDAASALFFGAMLTPESLAGLGLSAYLVMAVGPLLQRPLVLALTGTEERKIHMPPPRKVHPTERKILPIAGILITAIAAPGAVPLLGMFFFGNLLAESGVTERLGSSARNLLIDIILILLGFSVGAAAQADLILTAFTGKILLISFGSFLFATGFGVLLIKLFNRVSSVKLNPILGAAGLAVVPRAADQVEEMGREADPDLHLHPSATAPNISAVIGSAMAAGILWGVLSATGHL